MQCGGPHPDPGPQATPLDSAGSAASRLADVGQTGEEASPAGQGGLVQWVIFLSSRRGHTVLMCSGWGLLPRPLSPVIL